VRWYAGKTLGYLKSFFDSPDCLIIEAHVFGGISSLAEW